MLLVMGYTSCLREWVGELTFPVIIRSKTREVYFYLLAVSLILLLLSKSRAGLLDFRTRGKYSTVSATSTMQWRITISGAKIPFLTK
jgi:hypothetical protein